MILPSIYYEEFAMLITESVIRKIIREELINVLQEADFGGSSIPARKFLSPEEQFFGGPEKAKDFESEKVQQARQAEQAYRSRMANVIPVRTESDVDKAIAEYKKLDPKRAVASVISHVYHNFVSYIQYEKKKDLVRVFDDFIQDVEESAKQQQLKEVFVANPKTVSLYHTPTFQKYTIPANMLRPILTKYAMFIGSLPNASAIVNSYEPYKAIKQGIRKPIPNVNKTVFGQKNQAQQATPEEQFFGTQGAKGLAQ
jgi:hypothetical protein